MWIMGHGLCFPNMNTDHCMQCTIAHAVVYIAPDTGQLIVLQIQTTLSATHNTVGRIRGMGVGEGGRLTGVLLYNAFPRDISFSFCSNVSKVEWCYLSRT